MTSPPLTHAPRIIRRQRGPHLPPCHQFTCSCGARSPESVDRAQARLAHDDHIRQVGGGA